MNALEFIDTARMLVATDKGLLAMDESNLTCNKRFANLGIPQAVEARVLAAHQALLHRARYNRPAAPGQIQCRDGERFSLTTSIPRSTKSSIAQRRKEHSL